MFITSDTQTEKHLALVFLLILFAQNPPWPFWDVQHVIATFGALVGVLLTARQRFSNFHGGYFGFSAILGCFIYFFVLHGIAGSFRMSSLVFVLTIFLIFQSSTRTGALAFDLITYSFAAVLLVSFLFWLPWQFGLPLPSTPMTYGAWKGDGGTIQLDNFYFFISESESLLNRFYSVFDEPGVVGTLAAFILCGLRFDFTLKRTWVVLIGGLASWSLAFSVLSMIGIMIFKKGGKLKIVLAGVLVLIILGVILLFGDLLPSDDSAGLILLYRIANFSEYGVSSRTDDSLNIYFLEYINSLRVVLGEGTNFFQERPELLSGQGAIFYVIEYGIAGMVFLLATYVAIIRSQVAVRLHGYFLLGIFLLSFLQRPHMMTPWQIVLFWAILCYWSQEKKSTLIFEKKD